MRHSIILLMVVLLSLLSACQPVASPIATVTQTPAPSMVATAPLGETVARPIQPATATTIARTDTPTAVPVSATVTPAAQSKPTLTPNPLARKNATGGFPFPTGTTWVYSRVQYQQLEFDPTTIISATNLITASVIRTEVITPSVAMQYRQTASLVSAPPGWEDNSANFNSEFWYLLAGHHVFSSPEPPKSPEPLEIDVKGERTPLVYDFTLVGGKNWCPFNPPPSYNPNCVAMGRRTVARTGSYATPVGIFDECYQITEEYNSGGVTEWFCNGVGVVARKYDHSGTRFGFLDTLVSFSRGSAQ